MHFRPRCVVWWLYSFAYGNAAARTFGRAHRLRPYGFVWVDCVWTVGSVGVDCTWTVDFVWGELRMDGILFV